MGGNSVVIKSRRGPIRVPCLDVKLVPIKDVEANDYNPNQVSRKNMNLLMESIISNGFCFPVVTAWDEDAGKYVIIDGFHRYQAMLDAGAEELPVVVLGHDAQRRMEATVQFNRARGVHQVELMGDLVARLLKEGTDEVSIAKALGMELEEVLRLKQVTGIAELFRGQDYSRAWETGEV